MEPAEVSRPDIELSVRNKYRIVSRVLAAESGTVLDVGARDRVLRRWLEGAGLVFRSADVSPGCDYLVNLEKRLPFEDRAFDHTVALDVLEHVEHIHAAFAELARITRRRLVLGLPNFGSLPRRLRFLASGRFGTDKYDLLPEHQSDRHRWLTTHAQVLRFVGANADASGFNVTRIIGEIDGGRHWTRAIVRLAAAVLPPDLVIGRDIVVLTRRSNPIDVVAQAAVAIG